MDTCTVIKLVIPWVIDEPIKSIDMKALSELTGVCKLFRESVLATICRIRSACSPLEISSHRRPLSSIVKVIKYRSSVAKELAEKGEGTEGHKYTRMVNLLRFIEYPATSGPADVMNSYLFPWSHCEDFVFTPTEDSMIRSLIVTTRSKELYDIVITVSTSNDTVSLLKEVCRSIGLPVSGNKSALRGRVHNWILGEVEQITEQSMGLPTLEPTVIEWVRNNR